MRSSLKILANSLLFSILMCLAYAFIDNALITHSQTARATFYIPLRIISILISPATQLPFWTAFFVWAFLFKRSSKLSSALYPIAASLIVTNAIVRVMKAIIGRSRPDIFLSTGVYELKMFIFQRSYSSLPSGHAATVAAIFGCLAARYPKYALSLISLGVILSVSRVFIGAHYLSDVLVGDFLGLYTSWIIYYKGRQLTTPDPYEMHYPLMKELKFAKS